LYSFFLCYVECNGSVISGVVVHRLYSCLANGNANEFQKGEQLFKRKSVSNALQIGTLVSDKLSYFWHILANISGQ